MRSLDSPRACGRAQVVGDRSVHRTRGASRGVRQAPRVNSYVGLMGVERMYAQGRGVEALVHLHTRSGSVVVTAPSDRPPAHTLIPVTHRAQLHPRLVELSLQR